MTFDRNALDALLALDDRMLGQTVRGIAASRNLSLPEGPISAEDMRRLREAMAGSSQASIGDAMRILNEYEKRNR